MNGMAALVAGLMPVVAAMSACFAPSPVEGLACSSTGECPVGQRCHDGLCSSGAPADAAAPPVDAVPDGAPAPDGPSSSYLDAVLADGPVAYYRLAEAKGAVAIDQSGFENDAAIAVNGEMASFGEAGALTDGDLALGLTGEGNPSGTSAYVATPDTVAPWGADFTIEVWVKPALAPTSTSSVFIAEHYTFSGFRTGYTDNFEPQFWTAEGGGSSTVLSTEPLTPAAWNHLAFVRAGVTMTIYVNGIEGARHIGEITLDAPGVQFPYAIVQRTDAEGIECRRKQNAAHHHQNVDSPDTMR